jgi:hypothetical protein
MTPPISNRAARKNIEMKVVVIDDRVAMTPRMMRATPSMMNQARCPWMYSTALRSCSGSKPSISAYLVAMCVASIAVWPAAAPIFSAIFPLAARCRYQGGPA